MIRPADESEIAYVKASDRLYRACGKIKVARGRLEAFDLPSGLGRLYRNFRGEWTLHPTTTSLTTDSLLERRRGRDCPAPEDALGVVAMLTESIERGSPEFSRDGRMVAIDCPWGRLALSADGKEWLCRQDADPAPFELVAITWEPEPIPEPEPPAEPAAWQIESQFVRERFQAEPAPPSVPSLRLGEPVAVEVHERGRAASNADLLLSVRNGRASAPGSLSQRKARERARSKAYCPICRSPCAVDHHAPRILARNAIKPGGAIVDLMGSSQRRLYLTTSQQALDVIRKSVLGGDEDEEDDFRPIADVNVHAG